VWQRHALGQERLSLLQELLCRIGAIVRLLRPPEALILQRLQEGANLPAAWSSDTRCALDAIRRR
jgi:hypothetical protein